MTFLDQTGLERLWSHIIGRLNGMVQSVRTINGKPLTDNITLTAADVGADENGAAADALEAAKSYTDSEIADLINSAPTTLDTLGEIAAAMKENEDVVDALDKAIGSKVNTADFVSHVDNSSIHIPIYTVPDEPTNVEEGSLWVDMDADGSVGGSGGSVSGYIPPCSAYNEGQFLRVVNGSATWSSIPRAEEEVF